MMMVTALFTLALLIATPPASAACAWIMWSANYANDTWRRYAAPTTHLTWTILETADSRRECLENQRGVLRSVSATDGWAIDADTFRLKSDPTTTSVLHCLPDTVDPRTAK
jgi:hypothetical protein